MALSPLEIKLCVRKVQNLQMEVRDLLSPPGSPFLLRPDSPPPRDRRFAVIYYERQPPRYST